MKKFIIEIAICIFFLISSIFLIHFFSIRENSLEIRNIILARLLSGGLTFWILFAIFFDTILTALVYEFFKSKWIRYTFASFAGILTIISFLLALLLTFSSFELNINKDVFIYENKANKEDKIICQFWETGVGGNPNWRIIRSQNSYRVIRSIEVIQDSILTKKLDLLGYPETIKPSKAFIFQSNVYTLEQ